MQTSIHIQKRIQPNIQISLSSWNNTRLYRLLTCSTIVNIEIRKEFRPKITTNKTQTLIVNNHLNCPGRTHKKNKSFLNRLDSRSRQDDHINQLIEHTHNARILSFSQINGRNQTISRTFTTDGRTKKNATTIRKQSYTIGHL